MKKLVHLVFCITVIQLNLNAQAWEALNFNFGSFSFSVPHIGVSHDNMKLGAAFSTQYVGPMQFSTDGGENWSEVLDKRILSIQFDDAGNIYALHQSKDVIYFNGYLYKSTDDGTTWDELLDVDDYVETAGFKVTGSGEIYVPAAAGMKYSPDGGLSWSDITCNHVPYGVLKTSSGRLIITTYNSGIEYSDDNGATWSNAEGDLGNITFGFLQEHPTTGNIYVCSFGGVLESTDNGASFYLKDPDPWLAMNIKEFEISSAGKFYFYGLYGVYESTDAVTWNNITEGLPAGNLYDFQLTDDHVFVVVDTMIYKREIAASPSGIFSSRFAEIELNVWPNPAADMMNVSFTLEDREAVVVDIINMNGEIEKTIATGILPKGTNRLSFQLNGLSKGIYIARVRMDSGIGIKRIAIAK